MNKKQKLANNIFKTHKEYDKVYITSDGMPFITEEGAKGHQSGMHKIGKKGKVEVFKREKIKDKKEKIETLNADEVKALGEEKGIDYMETLKQAQLHALCKELEIEIKAGTSNLQYVEHIKTKLYGTSQSND